MSESIQIRCGHTQISRRFSIAEQTKHEQMNFNMTMTIPFATGMIFAFLLSI